MDDAFRNVIGVSFSIRHCLAIYCNVELSFNYDAPLGFVGMFRKYDTAPDREKQALDVLALQEVAIDSFDRALNHWQVSDQIGKRSRHLQLPVVG